MNIAQLCKHPVVSVDASASLREAASLLRSQHVGALVVTAASGDRPVAVGLVTDRDLALEVLARELSPGNVAVSSLASRKLVAVRAGASITEAVNVMVERGVRRLIVTDDDGRLVGLVSADDILEAIARDIGGLAHALRVGIAREAVERQPIAPPSPRPVFLPHGTPGFH